MTIFLLMVYAVIILVAIIVIGFWSWRLTIRQRRVERFEGRLSQRYMRIVVAIMLSDENLPTRFPMIDRHNAKDTLAKVLVVVAQSVYGLDVEAIGRIVADNHLDRWLLRQVQRSKGFDRAYYMSILALLPLSAEVVERAAKYANDSNRLVRFYALLVRISSDSSSALKALAEYGDSLTCFELAEIMALLRRGVLPVACEPLLASTNRNWQLVGVSIAKEFGVEEVVPQLLEIAATSRDRGVAKDAFYALIAMHASLTHPKIANSIRRFPASERRSLGRSLAYEGYSASVISYLLGERERVYAERLVATYKCRIVCVPQL